MAKFDGHWRCFLVTFSERNEEVLVPIGTMNLKFKPDGELEHGHWEYDRTRFDLEGVADPGLRPKALELETDSNDLFEGLGTYESGDGQRMVVTGKFHVAADSRVRKALKLARAQDDPPWVILKP